MTNRTCLYSPQLFPSRLLTCCCVVHTHQFEFADTSWPTFVWHLKAALEGTRNSEEFTGGGWSLLPPLFLRKKGFFKKKNLSSSWFPAACYGQFALPVCLELNVCKHIILFMDIRYGALS